MDLYDNYKLIRNGNGYTVVIYLNPNSVEFSKEGLIVQVLYTMYLSKLVMI